MPVSADCRTHNEAGHCTGCYKGYDLNEVRDADNNLIDVTCVYSPSNTAATANDSGDWPDLMNADCLQAFAQALLADGLVKPIPPATHATQSTNRVAGVAAPTADLPLL